MPFKIIVFPPPEKKIIFFIIIMGNYITKDGKTKSPIYTCQGTGVNKKCKMTPKWDKLFREQENIEILSGLDPGEMVVTGSDSKLVDGQRVEVTN